MKNKKLNLMRKIDVPSIRNLSDLQDAIEKNGLRRGSAICLDNLIPCIFLNYHEKALYGEDVIITIENDKRYGTARGLYIIDENGLYYQAHCSGELNDKSFLKAAGLFEGDFL